jgi:hypothetical protein
VVTGADGNVVETATWPPRDSLPSNAPDLPGPAYVISRVPWRQVVGVAVVPPLLYLPLFRMVGSSVPLSRVMNPGLLGLLVTFEVVLVAVCLARQGRATVVGTNDWLAVRNLFDRRWRQLFFAEVECFSSRGRMRPRGGPATIVTIADREGRRVFLTLGNDDPALAALLGRLRATGARDVGTKELGPMSRRQTGVLLVVLVGVICLPIGYLAVGPLRLLPRPIAGAFTWSGCRAALAVEGGRPEGAAPYVVASMQASGETWRLVATQQTNASTYAQHTQDPAARLAHLQADGFLMDYQAFVQNAAGAVVDVQMLRFKTQEGAQAYDTYINRAVCEQDWRGRSGPRLTEVFLHRGKSGFVRWVGGEYIIQVGQARSTPFSTPQQIEAIAAALLAGPASEASTRSAASGPTPAQPMARPTTSRAAACTCARCSGPRNDSA